MSLRCPAIRAGALEGNSNNIIIMLQHFHAVAAASAVALSGSPRAQWLGVCSALPSEPSTGPGATARTYPRCSWIIRTRRNLYYFTSNIIILSSFTEVKSCIVQEERKTEGSFAPYAPGQGIKESLPGGMCQQIQAQVRVCEIQDCVGVACQSQTARIRLANPWTKLLHQAAGERAMCEVKATIGKQDSL